MIYQLENAKKKIKYHGSDDFSGKLSEEALFALIEEVENGEMLQAPVHLKENVLAQIRKEQKAGRKRQLFTYRAKVLIAMAAALTVLLLMPMENAEYAGYLFMHEQTSAVSMEQAELERQKNIDAHWEKYREERAGGGVRGLFGEIGARVSRFGENLSWDRDGK